MAAGRASRRIAALVALTPVALTPVVPTCAAAEAQASASACAVAADAETAALDAIEERMVLRLADGRQLRLAGLDPAEGTPERPGRAEEARAALAAMVGGRPIRFSMLGGKPDRYGRRTALVADPDHPGSSDASAGLAERAVAAGLGRYLAEPLAHPCRDRLLTAEVTARAARLGLWSDGFYAVLAPTDEGAFAERSATTVVAQGRLTQVVPGPYRTELRLAAPEHHRALSVAIPPRAAKRFKDGGVDPSGLIGRTVRVRGLLDLRYGPRLEIGDPDALEVLGAAGTE